MSNKKDIRCKKCNSKLFEIERKPNNKEDNSIKILIKCRKCKEINRYYISEINKK